MVKLLLIARKEMNSLLNQIDMKKLFLFVALFTWIGFSASAQVTKDSTTKVPRTDSKKVIDVKPPIDDFQVHHPQIDRMKNHWIVRDGKVMEVKDGKEQEMTTETEVSEGVWIRPNGDVVTKDNEVIRLKDNQYLDEKGKIHDKKMKSK